MHYELKVDHARECSNKAVWNTGGFQSSNPI